MLGALSFETTQEVVGTELERVAGLLAVMLSAQGVDLVVKFGRERHGSVDEGGWVDRFVVLDWEAGAVAGVGEEGPVGGSRRPV